MLFKVNLEHTVDLVPEYMYQQQQFSPVSSVLVLLFAQHHQSIMDPPEKPSKTEAYDVASGKFLMTYLFANKKRRGGPKKQGNMADDNITVIDVKKAKSGRIYLQTAKFSQTVQLHPRNYFFQITLLPQPFK